MGGDTKSVAPRAARRAVRRPLVGPGVRLGRYQIVAPIARGGMAEVWLARQIGELGFRRTVALKTIRADYAEEPAFRTMFLNEARLAARIRHPNVVEVLDLGEDGATVYLAMTFVEGDSLAQLTRTWKVHEGRPLPLPIVLRVLADAAAGLHAAHELVDDQGVPMHLIHRDVSPQNILVGVDGLTRLTDFGIAKALGKFGDETRPGQVKGKLGYLAPEQAARIGVDRRSDIFAAGIVLWEAVTGDRLFQGEDDVETLGFVLGKSIPDPRTIRPDVPDGVARITLRALARAPEERFATAADFGDAIERAANESGMAATIRDVASFAKALVGSDVETLLSALRDASYRPEVSARAAASVPSAEARISGASSEPSRSGLRSRWGMPVAIGFLGIGAAIALALAPTRRAPAAPKAPDSAEAAAASPAAADAPAPTVAADAPVVAPADATAQPIATAAVNAASSSGVAASRGGGPRPVSPPPAPKSSPHAANPTQRPKFQNPYAQ